MTHLLCDLAQTTGLLYMLTITVVAHIAALAPSPQQRTDARETLALLLKCLTKSRR